MKKKRIFDLVFSLNDSKILECRYEYSKNYVDYFVFIKFDDSETLSTDKIIQINFQKNFKNFDQGDFEKLIQNLNEIFYFDIEDIFFISKSFEIPNVENISECISKLHFIPVLLEQKSLMWNHKTLSKFDSVGTQIFNYSQFLTTKKLFEFLMSTSKYIRNNNTLCNSGWNLSTFFDLQTFISNTKFWDNLGVNEFEIIDSYYTDYDFRNSKNLEFKNSDVPNVFKQLGHIPEQRQNLTLTITDNLENLTYGDYKVLLTDKDEIYEDIICYKIDYPNKVLYGDKNYIDFKYDYKKNEILKVFQNLKLIDDDEIHIKIKSELVSSDFICKFSEIKNGTPSLMF